MYTKGKWKVKIEGINTFILTQPEIRIEETEANARLIASAPELLEACKLAVNEYHLDGNCANAIAELKQAISKAEGK